MKRTNTPKDLHLYRSIFNVYYTLVSELIARSDMELENRKQERHLLRTKRNGQYRKQLLVWMDQAGIKERKVTIRLNGFTCSFPYSDVPRIKRRVERNLVTPKHHLYFVDVKAESKAA